MNRMEKNRHATASSIGGVTGVEGAAIGASASSGNVHVWRAHELNRHTRLTQVVLRDRTDECNELVSEREWLLHPLERLEVQGNLFITEDLERGCGSAWIRATSLPTDNGRPDARVAGRGGGFILELCGREGEESDPWFEIPFDGSEVGLRRSLQEWQRTRRPASTPFVEPELTSNTWGDRSQDGRLTEEFVRREVQVAAEIGVQVVQIDDGWQRGTSANSRSHSSMNRLEGFWRTDSRFWEFDPRRFPNGIDSLRSYAADRGVQLGLWYAPDSSDQFSHWRRDLKRITELVGMGIRRFKLDGIRAESELARSRLNKLLSGVARSAAEPVILDLDVTAGIRPGYFGALQFGPLFVENRYTDWGTYWPHQSLRNLWSLTRWIDPWRLRMEFLNGRRNSSRYGADPLAPSRYQADQLFATVMAANPLAWCELSALASEEREGIAILADQWKGWKPRFFSGTIVSVGTRPDGFGWSGFLSLGEKQAILLLFRGANASETERIPLPLGRETVRQVHTLAGAGKVEVVDHIAKARIPNALGYVVVELEG